MYKRIALPMGLLVSTCITTSITAQQKRETPNIIVILADDLGYSDLGCYGSEIQTPNIDMLASQGLRMTHMYNCSRSCPSRAALLTGLYPHKAGIGAMTDWTIDNTQGYKGYLTKHSVTIAQALKQNDYNTYISGKWHVGDNPENFPLQRGFDRFFGIVIGACSYFNPRPYRIFSKVGVYNDSSVYKTPNDFYMTQAITDNALQYLNMQKNSQNPFFLYMAYTAPHWPLHALPEDIELFRGKYMVGWDSIRERRYRKQEELGILAKNYQLSPKYNKHIPMWDTLSYKDKVYYDLKMATYAAMIFRMDKGIGKLVEKLKEIGEYDNTLIIFLSDNGGCSEMMNWQKMNMDLVGTDASFDSYDYAGANVSNTPYRMFKHWLHEGGISTPFIAWYPAVIKANTIRTDIAHITDVMPTILHITKIKYPKTYENNTLYSLPGKSLLPVFEGKLFKGQKFLAWEHFGARALRYGEWKIVTLSDTDPWELYNMEDDPCELNNLASKLPKKITKLEKIYKNWATQNFVIPFKLADEMYKKQLEQNKNEN